MIMILTIFAYTYAVHIQQLCFLKKSTKGVGMMLVNVVRQSMDDSMVGYKADD